MSEFENISPSLDSTPVAEQPAEPKATPWNLTEAEFNKRLNQAIGSRLKPEAIANLVAERLTPPKAAKDEISELESLRREVQAIRKEKQDEERGRLELSSVDALQGALRGKVKPGAESFVAKYMKGEGWIDHKSQTIQFSKDTEALTFRDGVNQFLSQPEAKIFLEAPSRRSLSSTFGQGKAALQKDSPSSNQSKDLEIAEKMARFGT